MFQTLWLKSVRYMVSLLMVGAMLGNCACAQSFTGIGFLFHEGNTADAISGDGKIVYASSDYRVLRWTQAGGLEDLGLPRGSTNPRVFGASYDGSVVVGRADYVTYSEAYRWTPADGFELLGTVPNFTSSAQDVSADGSTIVGLYGDQAAKWTRSTGWQQLGALPAGITSFTRGVSGDGSVVVGESEVIPTTAAVAVRWTQVGIQPLEPLPTDPPLSTAYDITVDGRVIVGHNDFNAYRWTETGGFQYLGTLPGEWDSLATVVSADGSVISGQSGGRAFVWDEVHGIRNLRQVLEGSGIDMGTWQLRRVTGISHDGRTIVGAGVSNRGVEGWVATLPPVSEPASIIAVSLGALFLGVRNVRK